jgi:uncharacterized membrane protein (UPF0127 family)
MTEPAASFGRHPWRDAFRPARHRSLEGWVLDGPNGIVAHRVDAALTPWRRLRGLLGRDELTAEDALLIRPCAQVHGVGMRHPFDAVFCDAELRVLHVSTIQPRRVSRYVRRAACCFELPAGRAEQCGIEAGAQLLLKQTL